MAIEDAAALGIIFSKDHFNGDVEDALRVYEKVRLPRATRVQSAAAKAAYNINERIGFSANNDRCATYKVENEKEKLTIEEMNAYDMFEDVEEKFSELRGQKYVGPFICGLPIGLEMPNGVTIGA
jgi:salicylate hydroxylase